MINRDRVLDALTDLAIAAAGLLIGGIKLFIALLWLAGAAAGLAGCWRWLWAGT